MGLRWHIVGHPARTRTKDIQINGASSSAVRDVVLIYPKTGLSKAYPLDKNMFAQLLGDQGSSLKDGLVATLLQNTQKRKHVIAACGRRQSTD